MKKVLIYICIILICAQCAQITPLTGGKKDTTPPKALSYSPENTSLNFNSKQIIIQFDEFIKLKDITNQFIITPQTKEMPDIQANGKILKITFNEPLLNNTTYKLSFGNAIIDLHEGNAIQNFEYVFSTGNTIDSLKLFGQVLNTYTKKPAAKLLVALYRANDADSVIYKDKPLYISKTDDAGNYRFNYLPNTPFKLIAIDDVNKNLMYDGSDEQIAFYDSLITPSDSALGNMLLFKETPFKSFIKKSYSVEYGKAVVVFNKSQSTIKSIIAQNIYHVSKNQLQDTITLYYNNLFDTLSPIISYYSKKADTLTIKIPSAVSVDKLRKNKALKYTWQTNITTVLPFYETPQFILNIPIDDKNMYSEKIGLYEKKDSILVKKKFSILHQVESMNTFSIQSEFKPETNYILTFDSKAMNDTVIGRYSDSISYKFTTTSPDDYAQLNINLFFPKKENYIVLLLNEKDLIVKKSLVSFSLTSTSQKILEYKNLLPGNYFVRVVEDSNKNGSFDMGNYFSHQQSEPVFVNPLPIKLLAGWEIENEWKIK